MNRDGERITLNFDQISALVAANKNAAAFTNECVIAVCWKESSFNPAATTQGSTATGLMQMTDPAVATVNANTPPGIHFEHNDMLDPAKAIQCGTYYLQLLSNQAQGDEATALNNYGSVPNYAKNVMDAEACLLTGTAAPMDCLTPIHPFLNERKKLDLHDDPTGKSRFISG